MRMPKKIILVGLVLFILFSLIAIKYLQIRTESPFTRESSFRGKYIFSGEPKLNMETQLTFSVSPLMDAANVDVRLLFSNGVELINENLDEGGGVNFKLGNINANKTNQRTMTVKVLREGTSFIEGFIDGSVYIDGQVHRIREISNIFLTVSKDKVGISYTPPPNINLGSPEVQSKRR